MKVQYGEEVANHSDPESCGAHREVCVEALTGETGRPAIEPRNDQFGMPTLLSEGTRIELTPSKLDQNLGASASSSCKLNRRRSTFVQEKLRAKFDGCRRVLIANPEPSEKSPRNAAITSRFGCEHSFHDFSVASLTNPGKRCRCRQFPYPNRGQSSLRDETCPL